MDTQSIINALTKLFSNITNNEQVQSNMPQQNVGVQSTNFPPPFSVKTQSLTSNNLPLYPTAQYEKNNSSYLNNYKTDYIKTTENYNNNTLDQPQVQNLTNNNSNTNAFNLQNIITSIMQNPEALNLIKQVLPALSSNNGRGGNLLTNLLGGFNKKTPSTAEVNVDNNQEFDIDSFIKIDDT